MMDSAKACRLKALYGIMRAGGRLTEEEKTEIGRAAVETLGLERAVKLLVVNEPYCEMSATAEEWSARLGIDPQQFRRAWRGKALEVEE